MNNPVNFKEFIDIELNNYNLRMTAVTEKLLSERFSDIKNFINGVRREFKSIYGWEDESEDYFLKPMNRKFQFSYMIENDNFEIQNISFNSVYETIFHMHFMYTNEKLRRIGLTKLQMINICQNAIDAGFKTISGYWPKNNNGSIALFLKMGWEIQSIRNDVDLYMMGNLFEIQRTAFELYCKERDRNN